MSGLHLRLAGRRVFLVAGGMTATGGVAAAANSLGIVSLVSPARGLFLARRREGGIGGEVGGASLRATTRAQGSLNKLLTDPNDAFLGAIMAYSLPQVAALALQDPSVEEDCLHLSLLEGKDQLGHGAEPNAGSTSAPHDIACKREELKVATASRLQGTAARSPADAVLQSLHTEGLRRREMEMKKRMATAQATRAAYAALPESRRTQLREARIAQHRRDALCAVNAILRTCADVEETAADGGGGGGGGKGEQRGKQSVERLLPQEDLEAIRAVRDAVLEVRAHLPEAHWQSEVAPELRELAAFMRAMGVDEAPPGDGGGGHSLE